MDRKQKAEGSLTPANEAEARKTLIKKIAARATTASADLENGAVPTDHIRSAGVKRLLSERQRRHRANARRRN